MAIRPMKWHIFGPEHEPLCWDGEALEFDTETDAREFLASAIAEDSEPDFYQEAVVAEYILYYDGGYLNATNYRVGYDDENCELILVMK